MANEFGQLFPVVIQKKGKIMKKMIVALAIIGLFGSASANSRQIPRRSYQTIIVQEKKTDVMPYVFLGVIAGVVIYHITQTRCDSGLICTKF